jgi:energy-converting hydrogenase Eha subunit H
LDLIHSVFFFFPKVATAELSHQGHLEGDKQEETLKRRFTMGLLSLLSSLPLLSHSLWIGRSLTTGSDKCVFILMNLHLLQYQKNYKNWWDFEQWLDLWL